MRALALVLLVVVPELAHGAAFRVDVGQVFRTPNLGHGVAGGGGAGGKGGRGGGPPRVNIIQNPGFETQQGGNTWDAAVWTDENGVASSRACGGGGAQSGSCNIELYLANTNQDASVSQDIARATFDAGGPDLSFYVDVHATALATTDTYRSVWLTTCARISGVDKACHMYMLGGAYLAAGHDLTYRRAWTGGEGYVYIDIPTIVADLQAECAGNGTAWANVTSVRFVLQAHQGNAVTLDVRGDTFFY